jgi:hypothetical protein
MKNQVVAPRVCGSLLLASTVAFAVACSGEHNPTAPSIANAPQVAEGLASVPESAGEAVSMLAATDKTMVCHRTLGTNDYVATQIPESALQSHMDHGDIPYSAVSLAKATYSASLNAAQAPFAFDGNMATAWGAGAAPVQHIEIEFGSPQTFWKIAALVDQDPSGATTHQVTLDGAAAFTWAGVTSNGDWLSHKFDTARTAQKVRITTTKSPSWVAWREIKFPSCA